MTNSTNSSLYEREILEFLTVSVEFCSYTEHVFEKDRQQFVETMQKLLPLLYIKGIHIPKYEFMEDNGCEDIPSYVNFENYEIVRNNVAVTMGEYDSFLDVFVEDMKYSDSPILSTISENIADIYQDIKNFVCAYKEGNVDIRFNAIALCKENFRNYWGQKLVNVLRAIHEVSVSDREDLEDEDY
jgi:hypothetical protein